MLTTGKNQGRHTRMRAARKAAVWAVAMYLCAMVSDTIVMSSGGSALLQGKTGGAIHWLTLTP
jgi:hypothetical protein